MNSRAHKVPILGSFIVRPRLVSTLFLMGGLFLLLPHEWRSLTRLLISWDSGIIFYLISTALMMSRSDNDRIRKYAAAQDEGGLTILALTMVGVLASLMAIMHELVTAKDLVGHAQGQAIGLAAATVFLSWMFMQTIFALHYAHAYYNQDPSTGDCGLEFPAKYMTPDYWDFVYFSFIIGTAAQTADINITSKTIRRVVTAQCVLVFFFNTTILALAINVGAGLV